MNGLLLYPLAFACIFLVGVVVLTIWRNALERQEGRLMASETKMDAGTVDWTADPTCYSMHTRIPFPDMMDFCSLNPGATRLSGKWVLQMNRSQEETQNCARVFGRNKDEMAANANLIAAAPDLYEALDAMVRGVSNQFARLR